MVPKECMPVEYAAFSQHFCLALRLLEDYGNLKASHYCVFNSWTWKQVWGRKYFPATDATWRQAQQEACIPKLELSMLRSSNSLIYGRWYTKIYVWVSMSDSTSLMVLVKVVIEYNLSRDEHLWHGFHLFLTLQLDYAARGLHHTECGNKHSGTDPDTTVPRSEVADRSCH